MCMSLSPIAEPTITDLPAPDTNTEGMRFELVCTFTGVPAPMIRWEKDESVFSLGVGRRIINSTGRSALEIESLRISDAGVYRCSVSNVGGMASRSVRLEVRRKEMSFASDVCYTYHTLTFHISPLLSHDYMASPPHSHTITT